MPDLADQHHKLPRPLASAVPARRDDHELIIRALCDRDEAAARRAMESHIIDAVAIINTQARIDQHGAVCDGLRPYVRGGAFEACAPLASCSSRDHGGWRGTAW